MSSVPSSLYTTPMPSPAAALAAELARKFGEGAEIRPGEPMSARCTFEVGGPAECFVRPSAQTFRELAPLLAAGAHCEGIPVFVLGAGANIVPADSGIPGIVIDTGAHSGGIVLEDLRMRFNCGTSLDDAAKAAAAAGLSGLEFFAGMPGSIGGAVTMNARCYGLDTAGVLAETEYADYASGVPLLRTETTEAALYGYKESPFRRRRAVILSATFALKAGDPAEIRAAMEGYRRDRRRKGHYRLPSAGSVFKNSPAFGMPVGRLVDLLGLRGLGVGGARVAPWHGNIIVNEGRAAAADIAALTRMLAARVREAVGTAPEPEVLFVGGGEMGN